MDQDTLKRLASYHAVMTIARADGVFDQAEVAFAARLLKAFRLTVEDVKRPLPKGRPSLMKLLPHGAERRYVYEVAFRMSYMDGELCDAEAAALERLRLRLGLSVADTAAIEARVLQVT